MTKRSGYMTSRILLIRAASVIFASSMLLAQSGPAPIASSAPAADAAPGPSFEVATIKPHAEVDRPRWLGIRPTPDGVEAAGVGLVNLVLYAYGHERGDQVSPAGWPEWVKTSRFDLQAKMSEADSAEMLKLKPAEAAERRKLAMQALLVERFKLKVHSEAGQAPIYELVVAKGGPKMEVAATDTSNEQKGRMNFGNGTGVARGISMEHLAGFLSSPNGLGRTTLDKQG